MASKLRQRLDAGCRCILAENKICVAIVHGSKKAKKPSRAAVINSNVVIIADQPRLVLIRDASSARSFAIDGKALKTSSPSIAIAGVDITPSSTA